mmetsp:Transcript_23728/g.38131  ORF Transcript_23728/g.38131 Transcript_23728/m.38131 type:complete len:213 (+) Transcript_23728:4329-4967(+)
MAILTSASMADAGAHAPTGAWLTSVTVIRRSTGCDCAPCASVAKYLRFSTPWKNGLGVYWKRASLTSLLTREMAPKRGPANTGVTLAGVTRMVCTRLLGDSTSADRYATAAPASGTFSVVVKSAPARAVEMGGVLRSRVRRTLIHTLASLLTRPARSITLNVKVSAWYPGCCAVPRTALKSNSSGSAAIASDTRRTTTDVVAAVYTKPETLE